MQDDDQNLVLAAAGQDSVDSANQAFYSRFPFPWPPKTFPRLEDPNFEAVMLNQSIGDFSHHTIPADASVWVAGCGTNQAVYTALRFPKARVTGSDLSATSLEMAEKNAKTLRISNLTLRQENLNQVTHCAAFDYIICTGVIHHNAEPAKPLANIARALRPNGVLELMVYNRFHRMFTSSFQKAVRIVGRYSPQGPGLARDLDIAKLLIATDAVASSPHMDPYWKLNDSHLADSLIQPLELSYTVESLDTLASECGLELLLPCMNQFDVPDKRVWTLEPGTQEMEDAIHAMPDVARWQLANLLFLGRSPMLWFFLTHRKNQCAGRYEIRVNEEFLDRRFVGAATHLRNYVREPSDLDYKLSPISTPYPRKNDSSVVQEIVRHANGRLTMREILNKLGVDITKYKAITDIRTQTTTSVFPYLRAL